MSYKNLNELLYHSSSARAYYFSLPPKMQIALGEHNPYIHTASELHYRVDMIQDYERRCALRGKKPL